MLKPLHIFVYTTFVITILTKECLTDEISDKIDANTGLITQIKTTMGTTVTKLDTIVETTLPSILTKLDDIPKIALKIAYLDDIKDNLLPGISTKLNDIPNIALKIASLDDIKNNLLPGISTKLNDIPNIASKIASLDDIKDNLLPGISTKLNDIPNISTKIDKIVTDVAAILDSLRSSGVKVSETTFGLTKNEWIQLSLISVNVGLGISTLSVLMYLMIHH
ncbi:hypothetical protein [Trichoplusia ni ascovirus 6b]|nr:hypothetical protein [Trichoplusia ni ascovirus 6b]